MKPNIHLDSITVVFSLNLEAGSHLQTGAQSFTFTLSHYLNVTVKVCDP